MKDEWPAHMLVRKIVSAELVDGVAVLTLECRHQVRVETATLTMKKGRHSLSGLSALSVLRKRLAAGGREVVWEECGACGSVPRPKSSNQKR